MNISGPFIRRPVATTLLAIALSLAGVLAFTQLPVSPLPQVDFPVIAVTTQLPGADPVTISSSVAAPLERQFGHIAGLSEMTSANYLGSSVIVLQFDLSKNIDVAAREVQAAINAARSQLPPNLPKNPSYRKMNPSDAPIMVLALTSDTLDSGHVYDAATTIMQQKLSQLEGVGQVVVGGSSLPAIRVELNPTALPAYGVGFEDVRKSLAGQNVQLPKGYLQNDSSIWHIYANDQLTDAADYEQVIVANPRGTPIQLNQIGRVENSVENTLTAGISKGKPAVLAVIFRQPGANIIDTVERVRRELPRLQSQVSGDISIKIALDQTTTIRASIHDVERTLVISVALVTLVVFLFLRNGRATFISAIAVPLSIIGTFGAMYLLGYSLDNLSLMALTIATGFVVDDAIVVIENIARYLEQGLTPLQAALRGSKEIGFTVLSITISLVVVFLPILLMGGIIGRLFREFAVTLSVSILISLLVSLTVTPMLCSRLLGKEKPKKTRLYIWPERFFESLLAFYRRTLQIALAHPRTTLAVAALILIMNGALFVVAPKGFFPEQDTGRILCNFQTSTDRSFQAMQKYMKQVVAILNEDPAIADVVGFTGSGQGTSTTTNTARLFISLKPLEERRTSAQDVIARLRKKMEALPGVSVYFQTMQDIRVGGRATNALYQYTLWSDNLDDLHKWNGIMLEQIKAIRGLTDVGSDEQYGGLNARLTIDRATAARLGVSTALVDDTLYDAFGQRQISTIYKQSNQYHIVMEAAPEYWQDPSTLSDIYVQGSNNKQVPLAAVTNYRADTAPLAVNHQGQYASATISFNVAEGMPLGDAVKLIDAAARRVGMPPNVQGGFQGTAKAFQESVSSQPLLIALSLLAVYVVLGILYESYIHPVTILSTLPSAGTGALIALILSRTELSIIALIGIILLIGIVKKNAIMMIDFALEAERAQGKTARESIYEACLLRFRPILMTTMAALLGAVPLALGHGMGSELRRPLGIAIIGGLIVSQVLTLYTTPVIYLYMESLQQWWSSRLASRRRMRLAVDEA